MAGEAVDRPARARMPMSTRVLVALALVAVIGALVAVVVRPGAASTSSATGKPSSPAPLAIAHPVAADPCSWLAPADYASVDLPTAALTAYRPALGLEPDEVECTGAHSVMMDLRWSVNAKTAGEDLTGYVYEMRQSGWTVQQVTIVGANAADYVSATVGPNGRPEPAAQLLVQLGPLRILLTAPAAGPDDQAHLTTLANLLVHRIVTLHFTKAPSAPPSSAAPSTSR